MPVEQCGGLAAPVRPPLGVHAKQDQATEVRRNFAMSSQSRRQYGRAFAMLAAVALLLCTFTTLAAAQDQPVQKWEIYAGYSFFYPNPTVNVQLPSALSPLSSMVESNPWGIGASGTY